MSECGREGGRAGQSRGWRLSGSRHQFAGDGNRRPTARNHPLRLRLVQGCAVHIAGVGGFKRHGEAGPNSISLAVLLREAAASPAPRHFSFVTILNERCAGSLRGGGMVPEARAS